MAKIHSMSIQEFMNRDSQVKRRVSSIKTSIPIAVGGGALLTPVSAFAAWPEDIVKENLGDLIMTIAGPLIEIVQAAAYPAGVIGLSIAGLKMMINQRDSSLNAIQAVALGYLIIQLSPWGMSVLEKVGSLFS